MAGGVMPSRVILSAIVWALFQLFGLYGVDNALAAVSNPIDQYCVTPQFITGYIPPQILINMGKDHKFYYPAYNDASDIVGDGKLATTYLHSFDYYGYFDPHKCYSYASGVFVPYGITSDKYCSSINCVNSSGQTTDCSGKSSGNFLNWVAMSRSDVVKMVLYGGYRTSDNNGSNYAELSGENIPQDGHIWGKEYLGADADKLFTGGVANKRALFCVNGTGSISQLKVLPDVTAVSGVTVPDGLRAWHWINVNGNTDICSDTKIDLNGDGVAETATLSSKTNYNVTVRVCDPAAGFNYSGDWEKKHCKNYSTASPQDPNGPWRPVGLLQLYGVSDNTSKICSKDLLTSCTNDNGCTGKGQCLNPSDMFFGLIAGSYTHPKDGGYVRKDIYSINEEVNTQGILQTSASSGKGLLIKSIEELRCPTTYPLITHLGNPMGEIMYEGLRYWSGRGTPTTAFVSGISNGASGDSGYYASQPSWDTPASLYPACSLPFNLVISDVYNSYDHDQIPGSAFASVSGDLTGFNAKDLADKIWANEKLGTPLVVGESGTVTGANTDGTCGGKTVTGLGSVKGICPAEGNLSGTYYPAAVALYGHNLMKSKMGTPNVLSYVVAFNSNVPEIKVFTNSGKSVLVAPYGKSVSTLSWTGGSWNCTKQNTNFTIANVTTAAGSTTQNLQFVPQDSSSNCPNLAQVSFYVLETEYDSANNLKYIKFRTATDDLGGGDFDLDMLTEYTVCAQGATNASCPGLTGDQIWVKTERIYSSAGNPAALGFTITGAGGDSGTYLIVQHTASPPSGTSWSQNPLPSTSSSMTFVAAGSATLPKPPLWYAAKYGGFRDFDGDGLPYTDSTCSLPLSSPSRNAKCNEWSSKVPGVPDTYFEVSNPTQMEQRLREALDAIMARVSSGTAASLLSNSEGSGANMLQAVFYPKRKFYNETQTTWIGEIQNMWYYIDPFIGNSTVREDTDYSGGSHSLDLKNDLITQYVFDGSQTMAWLYKDSKGNGQTDNPQPSGYPLVKSYDDVKSIWKGGQLLWERDLSSKPRRIFTSTNGINLVNFSSLAATDATVQKLLQAASATEAATTINYTVGNSPEPAGTRSRTIDWKKSDGTAMTSVWRLGDVITSTPRIQSTVRLNAYGIDAPTGYGDSTYTDFTNSTSYKNRGMVYFGANDGMLHALKLGILDVTPRGSIKGTLSGANLGQEEWAYIPRQVLPYLKYYSDPSYNHIYTVDGVPQVVDVSYTSTGCSDNYWNCSKSINSWASVLIGSMGQGGASRVSSSTCTDCVKTPTVDPAATSNGMGYSSYFALDVTNQYYDATDNLVGYPQLLWEFSHPKMGFATSGVAVVRINSKFDAAGARKNGRWVGVIASGPTGPIDTTTHQFKGRSDQNLYLFVIDLQNGALLSKDSSGNPGPIDTGIPLAFAGPITNGVIDTHRWNAQTPGKGNYQDDALYIGYTKADPASTSTDRWTLGGVLRMVIPQDTDPDNLDVSKWKISKVIDNIGPVTTGVAKLQDRKNGNLWLYFGTGRYFFPNDENADIQRLYGVKDMCYKATVVRPSSCNASKISTQNDIDDCLCAASGVSTLLPPTGVPVLDSSYLTNQSGNSISDALSSSGSSGWYVNLAGAAGDFGAERSITAPVALTNGCVMFTTFLPTANVCGYGGNSYLWMMKYDTGYTAMDSCMQATALIQVSTGSFEQKKLQDTFNKPIVPKGQPLPVDTNGNAFRKSSVPMVGKPPGEAPPIITKSNLKPVKKIIHMQER